MTRRKTGIEITGGNKRRVQVRRERRNSFDDSRRNKFLQHFAATCNVGMAAEAAGIALPTVYKRRTSDPVFRAAWEAAQQQGYAALEAALVQRALDAANNVVPDEAAMADNYKIAFKDALTLLQLQGRLRERKPGDAVPRKSDLSEATKRLEKILRQYGALTDADQPDAEPLPADQAPGNVADA